MQSVTCVVVVLAVVLAVVVAPAAAVPNPLPSNVKTSYKGDITVIAFGGPQTLSDSTMALDQLSSRVTLSSMCSVNVCECVRVCLVWRRRE